MLPELVYGHAFSPEVLASEPVPAYNRDAIPWLQRDRKYAVEGGTRYNHEKKEREPDGMGLEQAQKELRRLTADLDAANTPNRRAILTIMVEQQARFVQFWEGKIWLLDQMIERARKEGTT